MHSLLNTSNGTPQQIKSTAADAQWQPVQNFVHLYEFHAQILGPKNQGKDSGRNYQEFREEKCLDSCSGTDCHGFFEGWPGFRGTRDASRYKIALPLRVGPASLHVMIHVPLHSASVTIPKSVYLSVCKNFLAAMAEHNRRPDPMVWLAQLKKKSQKDYDLFVYCFSRKPNEDFYDTSCVAVRATEEERKQARKLAAAFRTWLSRGK